MEHISASLHGIYRDVVIGPQQQINFDSGWVANTIVDHCRILLAALIKEAGTISNDPDDPLLGIAYLAVGQGQKEWDQDMPSPQQATTTRLVTPYTPYITDLNVVYLDQEDKEVAGPTPRLQIKATLPPGYPTGTNYPLREFGLFAWLGKQNGDEKNAYMINCVRHPVINKAETDTLIRMIRLYF